MSQARRVPRLQSLRFVLSAAVLWPVALAHAECQTRPARPPNVLLIMTDQQYAGVLGCAGNPLVKTPSLARLAAQGARITQAVCATPFCTPTRASIRTGQWPHTHGLTYNVAPDQRKERPNARRGEDRPARADRAARRTRRERPQQAGLSTADRSGGLSDDQVILDNLLFDRGYRLNHLGKWHLGDLADLRCFRDKAGQDPDRVAYAKWLAQQGEGLVSREARPGETFVDEAGGVFVSAAIARTRSAIGEDAEEGAKEARAIGRSALAPQAQFETWLADQAIAWIEKNAARPFMLTFSVSPPHAPWIAPDPYYSMYDPVRMVLPDSFRDRPAVYRTAQAARMGAAAGEAGLREQLRCYYAQVTMMDEQIGRILDKLRELGLERDTLVIFTSDHGDMQGAHGMMGKSVHAFYEEDVRVPLIFRYPPTIKAGRVIDMTVNSVDLMPTVLEYAGLPIPPGVQGRSVRSILDGAAKPDDRPGFCERGLRGGVTCRMIRTAEWKYNVYPGGRRELFHLADDPGEMRNLANDPRWRSQRDDLERQLRDHMRVTKDPALDDLFRAGQ